MSIKLSELKNKRITLRSQRRMYQFYCRDASVRDDIHLIVKGYGPEPDATFINYSTVEINGVEYAANIQSTFDSENERYGIELVTIITDQELIND